MKGIFLVERVGHVPEYDSNQHNYQTFPLSVMFNGFTISPTHHRNLGSLHRLVPAQDKETWMVFDEPTVGLNLVWLLPKDGHKLEVNFYDLTETQLKRRKVVYVFSPWSTEICKVYCSEVKVEVAEIPLQRNEKDCLRVGFDERLAKEEAKLFELYQPVVKVARYPRDNED